MLRYNKHAVSRIAYGFQGYLRGIRWLLNHKIYLFISFLPAVVGLLIFLGGGGYFLNHFGETVPHLLFDKPNVWYLVGLWWLAYALVFVALMSAGLLISLLVVNILAAPLYEVVSEAVERDLTGTVKEISLTRSLRLVGEELKKVGFILIVTLLSFFLSTLIPPFGFVAFFIAAFLVGWDFYDYPLARRGLKFRQRLNMVLKDIWAVTAFGVWLLVPFMQFFLMPLAVAGGTILCIEGLKEQHPESKIKE